MATLARITLVGNLGRDPETRYTPNGRMNVQFTMAVNRRFSDQSGQQQERTNWFRITAWGRLAETLNDMAQNGALARGKQVFVDGRFEARDFQDQQGQTRTSLDVTADNVLLLGAREGADSGLGGGFAAGGGFSQSSGAAKGQGRSGAEGEGSLDDLPWNDNEPPF
jgi:single-strand DNA-binding protein